ncbi:MAG: Ig-like domain-containing protein [Agathobacter sp.]|nr:Ig-like domain-containing protein [Agathobacter sp.]
MKRGILKRIWVVLLAICILFTQGNIHAFAAETPNETLESDVHVQSKETTQNIGNNEANVVSKYVEVGEKTLEADATVNVAATDSYETVLVNTVAAFKQAILTNAKQGKDEASVTFSFKTKDSYTKMFDYLTDYLYYGSDWEPEMGLLEMALYNEPQLRTYMNYGSAEHHFVQASQDEKALKFTIYWPIFYNQTVKNHVSVTRSDGKVTKQSFVVLEDALEAMEKWNVQYGSDVDYTIEFLDLYSSLIAPDRQELPEANNIEFIANSVYEEVSDNLFMGVPYSLFIASDLQANSNISMSTMNVRAGAVGNEGFTLNMNGATFASYGFNDMYFNLVNGDVFIGKETFNNVDINEEARRVFRIFGEINVNTVRAELGILELAWCYNSQINKIDTVECVYVYGGADDSLRIGTIKNSDVYVQTSIGLTIGDIVESRYSSARLIVGMPEKGYYPTITGTVTDGNGSHLPLELKFDDNFYTYAYDDTYYQNINFDKDWILLNAPNVDKVNFVLDHTVYDENLRGWSMGIEGVLSKNASGQFYLKSTVSWDGMDQEQLLEIGKTYNASIQVYQDGVLLDDSKLTTNFESWYPANEHFVIEKDGNNYTYSCDEFGYYTDLALSIQIDQEEGVTYWHFPVYAYVQKEVDSITIPNEKLTYIEGLGNVYLMVMNGKIYNIEHEGITPSVVSDAEYFVRYTSSDYSILAPDYITGQLVAYNDGLCQITASSGNKSATYKALVGKKAEKAWLCVNKEDVSKNAYYTMKIGEKIQVEAKVPDGTLEAMYGYKISWNSSDASVAKVDATGTVTALKAGKAILKATVTCLDGSKLTTEIELHVTDVSDEPDKPGDVAVKKVKLNKSKANLGVGKTFTLKATITPTNATNQKLTWSSSNKKIATVDKNGKVKGVKAGTATITVKAANGKKATCKVTVVKATLNATSFPLQVKKTAALKATSTLKGDEVKSWTSSNKKIATVTSKGVVKGIKAGKATITVKMKSGATAKCTVTVQTKKVTTKKLILDQTKVTLQKGKTVSLKVTRNPISATGKITWTSSNKKIATVDKNGKVKGVKTGTATITAKSSNGKKVTCKVTVKNPTVKLEKTKATIKVGKTTTIKIKSTFPENDKVKSYTSSNKKIATVTSKGVVKGVKAGKATITVKMKSGATAKFTITVKKK